ncbi:ElyC/SanA/YdcF family protein [Actinoplanes sp. HUAS TT8]|uniref:ElyC/SanA/YdcF family protein n=1 Tax=Actinoplanes sp. HUAS TT8 TaxID=3447453 RepID=UPI003F51CDD4
MDFELLPGTAGLTLDRVAHILVPGRGRDDTGFGLTPAAAARVDVAAALFREVVGPRGGRIVCAGYKSPADRKGTPWTTPDAPGETFQGRPEADAMRATLIAAGLNPDSVRAERRSVDTVTNLLRAEHESHFGDPRPVAIVSERTHLDRILTVIAPRALLRPYVGIVVPAFDRENPIAALVSRLIVTALPADPARSIEVAHRRAELLWRLAGLAGKRTYH